MRTSIVNGDFGFIIRVLFLDQDGSVLDLSAATTKSVTLIAPSGAAKGRTAAFTTDGTDGLLQYETVATDIDEAGGWRFQFTAVAATIYSKSHEPVKFPVAEAL
jgi:hypothetical protein